MHMNAHRYVCANTYVYTHTQLGRIIPADEHVSDMERAVLFLGCPSDDHVTLEIRLCLSEPVSFPWKGSCVSLICSVGWGSAAWLTTLW